MDAGVFSFKNIEVDHSFLDQVWKFSPSKLGSLSTEMVSMYSLSLAQFLIFFKSEQNITKAILAKKRKLMDSQIALAITPEITKKFKTKAAQVTFVTNTLPELNKLSDEIDELSLELTKIEGIDKSISEYIATFKRELSRREKELYAMRSERR